jgi:glycosyltransferase involved in cell wall biosynthesis
MIDAYVALGYHVYLLAMNTHRHFVDDKILDAFRHEQLTIETVYVDNRLSTLSILENYIFSKKPNHLVRYSSAAFAHRVKEVFEAFQPNIIQLESVFLTQYVARLRQSEWKFKNVLRVHNLEHYLWNQVSLTQKNIWKKIFLNSLSRRLFQYEVEAWKQFDLLLTFTDGDAEEVAKYVSINKLAVVPLHVNLKVSGPQNFHQPLKGYHLGAMDWMPNTDGINWFIKDVWPEVRKSNPKFEFYLAGTGISDNYKRLDIPGIKCEGYVSEAEVFLIDKHILIVPLLSGSGVRVKILEAMAWGKIVISTDIGMAGITAEPGKHYLRANDARSFNKSVAWCHIEQKEAANICENAKAFVLENYSFERVKSLLAEAISFDEEYV